ncbi:MAG: NHL repeat-containing protein [Gammaproteobacteria bacterium]|nr:NHL repeat-containing protein [Gammaproteobacteria bacterium]
MSANLVLFTSALSAAGMGFEPVAASEAVLSRPHDLVLAPDGRFLYVADLGHHVVHVLDPDSLKVIGAIGASELSAPHDVAFDPQGRLYVADTGNDRVAIYEVDGAAGRLVSQLDENIERTEGVAPVAGGRIYVTSVARNEVSYFESGRKVKAVGGSGRGPNQYSRPHDIDVLPDGRVVVADPGNNRLQILSAELEYLTSVGGPAPHDFNEPKYFGIDEKGRIYVGDQFNHRVLVFDLDWKLLGRMGTGESGDRLDQFNGLEGVVVRGRDVWISDTYNHRVVRYRRTDGGS